MNLLILGASGATGKQLVSRALAAKHQVTAVSHHPERSGPAHRNLSLVTGDVATDAGLFDRILPGHDAVLSTLGRGLSFNSKHVMKRSMSQLVPAITRLGPRRLIVLSAFGVGDSYADAPLGARIFFSTLLRGVYADKAAAEALIRASELDWTLVNPVQLINGDSIGVYRVAERISVPVGAKMTRASVAEFMLRAIGDRGTVGKRLVLSP